MNFDKKNKRRKMNQTILSKHNRPSFTVKCHIFIKALLKKIDNLSNSEFLTEQNFQYIFFFSVRRIPKFTNSVLWKQFFFKLFEFLP